MIGLKITTPTPIVGQLEPQPNVEVKFKSVFLDEQMNAQIEVSMSLNGEPIQNGFVANVVKQNVPQYDLTPVYAIVKAAFEAQGLTVEEITGT